MAAILHTQWFDFHQKCVGYVQTCNYTSGKFWADCVKKTKNFFIELFYVNTDVRFHFNKWLAKTHTTMVRQSVMAKAGKMAWLLAPRNKLSLYSSHDIQVHPQPHMEIRSSSLRHRGKNRQILRRICNAPWYIRNSDIERDLKVPKVGDVIQLHAARYLQRLGGHPNALARRLINPQRKRRLKRCHPLDLPTRSLL